MPNPRHGGGCGRRRYGTYQSLDRQVHPPTWQWVTELFITFSFFVDYGVRLCLAEVSYRIVPTLSQC